MTATTSRRPAVAAIAAEPRASPIRPAKEEAMERGCHGPIATVHGDRELQLSGCVLTMGAFDGVHLGHQELIRQAIRSARALRLPAVVYTFDTPPKVFFGQAEALTSLAARLTRIRRLGPDHIIVAHFAEAYRRRSAADFIAELGALNPHQIWVGEDFRFGSCKTGNVDLLRSYFNVRCIDPVRCENGEMVSSSRIRRLRHAGQLGVAAALEGWKGIASAKAISAAVGEVRP
jgi:riboflavin kinase / FMN adenylyltransferase